MCLLCGTSFKIFVNMMKFIGKNRFRNSENLYFGCTESLRKNFKSTYINTPSGFCKHQKSSKLEETLKNLPGHETEDIVLSIITVSRTSER